MFLGHGHMAPTIAACNGAGLQGRVSALDTRSASDDHQPMVIQVLIFGIHLARSTRGKPCAPPQA
jgi:hypothetical protein